MRRTDQLLEIGLKGLYLLGEEDKWNAADFLHNFLHGILISCLISHSLQKHAELLLGGDRMLVIYIYVGYNHYEACKPEVKDLLVKSLKFLPRAAFKDVLTIVIDSMIEGQERWAMTREFNFVIVMENNNNRGRKSILSMFPMCSSSPYYPLSNLLTSFPLALFLI